MNETLQIIVAVLGILSQILLLIKQFYLKEAPDKDGAPSAKTPLGQINFLNNQRRSLLDLSFVLICAAFFALLLTDSLIISGRNPSPGPATIGAVFVITSVVVVTMCGAWFLGASELVTGFLAVTTFIVLIISRGGPFFGSESDSVAALSLLVPVVALLTLASTMFIYSFGSPFSRAVPKRTRLGISLALTGLIIVASAALGKQLVQDVANNERSPKIKAPAGKKLLQNVMTGSLQQRREFYKLASEIGLAGTYGAYYRQVSPSQTSHVSLGAGEESEQKPQQTSSPSPRKTPDAAKPQPGNQQGPKAKTVGEAIPKASPTPYGGEKKSQWPAEHRAKMKDLIDKAWRDEDYSRARVLEQTLAHLESTSKTLNEEGAGRINFLLDYFEAADPITKEKYMTNRLEWIHPVGLENQSEAVIPLPGWKVEQRFDNISTLRIFKALYDQSNLRKQIIAEFEYPEDVRTFFREQGEAVPGLPSSGLEKLYKPTLFPKFDSTTTNTRLQEQLGLPRKEEAFLAYKEYRLLASLLLKQDLAGKIGEAELDKLSETFSSLDDAAQDAFRSYVINNKNIQSEHVYKMLLALKEKEIDFDSLAESQDPLAIEKLSSMLAGNRLSNNPALQSLADDINTKVESREAKETLAKLLKSETPDIPIKRLFQRPVFELVSQMNKFLGQDKKMFFDSVADPVSLVVTHIARTQVAQAKTTDALPIDSYLQEFRSLTDDDQAGILLQLAISLYQPGGPYSLDPVRLLVSQALSWNSLAALLCASLLALPILLLGVLAGGYFSRKLVGRDRTRELVAEEAEAPTGKEITVGRPVELRGRDGVLENLRCLAERGWSTIGVVGRRGVGKSRILYALSKEKTTELSSPTVKVWVSSPSKFQEEDFIHSIFERLALSTEAAIATFLGAKPLSTRKIESHTAQVGAVFYIGAWVVLAIVVYEMYNRLTRADIVITWLPILALVCTSAWLFFSHVSKLQPVDLSSWLQRDRTHNPHTVILYREVYDVLRLLRRRSRNATVEGFAPRRSFPKVLGLTLLGVIFFASSFALVILLDNPFIRTSYYLLALTIAVLSLVGWIYLYRRLDEERVSNFGSSMMSLIADYRSFVTSMVHRLRQGALGHRSEQRFPVLICIDELDKVVDFEEIRAFVRRIKAIFEVPGVYYYVSLAEDTLTALYLGPAEGKNEIDSAFDHIVRIPPLDCDAGEGVATEYLLTHGVKELPLKLARTISTVSFGVPRDIIRRCDELFAAGNGVGPGHLAKELRTLQLTMGYELKQLSKAQIECLDKSYNEAACYARATLNNGVSNPTENRLILSIWLLSLIEGAVEVLDGEKWRQVSKRQCDIGYKLPVDSIADLRAEIEQLHSEVLGVARSPVISPVI